MTQHFTRNTVSATFYCGKCGKSTQHRIDFVNELRSAGKKGPCLECIARLDRQHDEAPTVEAEKQQELFHV